MARTLSLLKPAQANRLIAIWRHGLLLALLIASPWCPGAEAPITVLNPTGFPPPIELKPMASRPASLAGKPIYLVDVTFDNGDRLLEQMQIWLQRNMPEQKTVLRSKRGIYSADDPDLWKEIQAAGGVMVMAIGH
jgi:hypothetical protein